MAVDSIEPAFKFTALGTKWCIIINNQCQNKSFIYELLQSHVLEFENKYSRFKNTSQISLLNQERSLINPDAELVEMLELAQKWFELSGGIFNVLVADYLEKSGYNTELNFQSQNLETAIIGNPLTDICIEDNKITLQGNSRIDLGGLGKGFLVDAIKDLLREKFGLINFVINAGGDIYFSSEKETKTFYLNSPFSADEYISSVELQNQALCSSSRFLRAWTDKNSGQKFNHLVETKTLEKMNIEFVTQSYVIANRAVIADILATIICLKGLNTDWIKNIQTQFPEQNIIVYAVARQELITII